jgi:glycosyltransferase involved in cell wall biosynthesis
MHVGLFAPAWPLAGHASGVVTYVHWMREGLLQRGHRVTVFAANVDAPEAGVRPLSVPLAFRVRRWWRSRSDPSYQAVFDWGQSCALHVRAVHRRDPLDVIEMEESFGWVADVMRDSGRPTVVKLHGPAFLARVKNDERSPSRRARIEREGEALRAMPVVIAPARHTLEATIARYGLHPAVARHVVNPIRLPEGAPVWQLESCDRRTILFVGRFDELKGGDVVLRAFARLLDRDPTLRLIFVGPDLGIAGDDGVTRRFEACRTMWLRERADRVDYRGALPPAAICRLRAESFATIVASRWENQSYTMLEAMLQGCPIVSSDAGGHSESVRHEETGLLATAGDPESLAARLATLLDHPDRAAALGARARAHVLEHHSPDRVVEQMLGVYEQTIALAQRTAASPHAAAAT